MTQPLVEPEPPRPRRSAGAWLALLILWAIGLCIWAGYISVLFIAFLKLFG
jgi:hypothetical protein